LLFSLFFLRLLRPLSSTLFPYTTLFRSELVEVVVGGRALVLGRRVLDAERRIRRGLERPRLRRRGGCARAAGDDQGGGADHERADRKSTRLNSSHVSISYAVFCLKKKTY